MSSSLWLALSTDTDGQLIGTDVVTFNGDHMHEQLFVADVAVSRWKLGVR